MTTCWETKKDEKVNRETAFIRNGSILLEKLVDICDGKCNSIRRFSAAELEKATNNYDPQKLLTRDAGYKLQMPYNHSRPEEENFLQNHVEKCIEDDRLNEAIDSTIIAEGDWPGKEQQLQAFAALALRCTSTVPEDRPTMIDVSKELRKMHRSAISCRQQQG
ncbi:PROTEIN KINASE putative-RELATED [Salix purpurea]|uniref:PROTEIN KINASE putative-RELATED n=1 Tax=Salix purpurea TaxID=77065 RepID=A0A9Q0W9X7_SALPP|nr:PROTEIN KINASE putative-RELATED [Salix purpurea]